MAVLKLALAGTPFQSRAWLETDETHHRIALQAETKRSMKMVSDNLGPIIAGDGRRFLDTPSMSATRARCIYLGKLIREQPKWQRDNPDNIRLLTVAEQTALAPRTESTVEAALPPVSVPTL